MARLGIFGGSFDPPHLGHLILAETARAEMRLDSVWWLLTPDPPHKDRPDLTSYAVRRRMLEAAIAGNDGFLLCEVECERAGPHYLIDSVHILQDRHPEAEFFLIMGEDSLRDLPGWHRPAELISAAPLVAMHRPHALIDPARLERSLPGILSRTTFLDAPGVDISSTAIRARIHSGRSCRYLIPESVEGIIAEMGVYR